MEKPKARENERKRNRPRAGETGDSDAVASASREAKGIDRAHLRDQGHGQRHREQEDAGALRHTYMHKHTHTQHTSSATFQPPVVKVKEPCKPRTFIVFYSRIQHSALLTPTKQISLTKRSSLLLTLDAHRSRRWQVDYFHRPALRDEVFRPFQVPPTLSEHVKCYARVTWCAVRCANLGTSCA
eukprot:2365250-Rhodomonas_salina.1